MKLSSIVCVSFAALVLGVAGVSAATTISGTKSNSDLKATQLDNDPNRPERAATVHGGKSNGSSRAENANSGADSDRQLSAMAQQMRRRKGTQGVLEKRNVATGKHIDGGTLTVKSGDKKRRPSN